MGSRSGKRLTNEQRKENRRRRLREKQKRPRPTHRPIRTGYGEIHQALKQYILAYVNSYHSKPSYKTLTAGASLRSINIREPVVGQDLILDIRSITYEDDWCSVDIAIHTEKRRYGENLNRWSMCFSDPNFFPLLRVYLDNALALYWGCGSYSGEVANRGGFLDYCIPDLKAALAGYLFVKAERSEGPLDLAPVYTILHQQKTVGSLVALDGEIRLTGSFKVQQVSEPMAWIAKGYTHAFASRVAREIKNE